MHRSLYPRQGTMLKIAFLQTDLFTEFDHQVIGEWIESFKETGNNGCQPDIYERIEICKREGRPWFREWVNAIGRRGSKGFIGGIAGAYVLWHYLSKGDPQAYYGIDRDKRLSMMVFAGKKEQAKDNQWKDLVDLIKGARCFAPYISRILSESLTIYAPHDFVRIGDREDMGVYGDDDMASFILLPKESTVMASRGPAVCSAMFDEMSHVVRQYAKSEACLDPSSRVLCADLIWRPIGALKVGDKLVGLEEEVTAGITRKLKEAKIVAVTWNVQRPYKLTFDDGSHVICSGNHRWLHHQIARWGPTRRLRVGSRIRAFVDPWETDMSYEAGYLKGFFDGEGHIIGTGKARGDGPKRKTWGLGFSQNPGPVLDHVKNLMSICGFAYRENGLNRECHQTYLRGLDESVRFLGKIRPKRLLENSSRVWVGKTPQGEYKTIVAIERLPEQVLVDLETTTHTYIAEGLVSHNSEVYESTIPALDTFGVDAFIYEPSSTWQMAGQFYDNWCQSLKVSDGTDGFGAGQIIRPEMLMFQLTSWDIYTDWERADQIPVRPGGYCYHRQKRPQQVYDEQMRRIEAANPESFRVERRSHWAAVLDAYLNPDRVDQMFEPWPPENPSNLRMVTSGKMNVLYKAHGDPSKCLTGESLVFSDGGVRRIDQVQATDELVTRDGIDEVAEWIDSGIKDVFRVETKQGYSIRGSAEHPLWVMRADGFPRWVRIKDLTAGDHIALRRGMGLWATEYVSIDRPRSPRRSNGGMCEIPSIVDEDIGTLLGYCIAEGSIGEYQLSIASNVNEDFLWECGRIIKDNFGLDDVDRRREGNGISWYWRNAYLTLVLGRMGVPTVTAGDKEVPWVVLQSPREVVSAFLRAYFDGDGMATQVDANDPCASAVSKSRKLIEQVQVLLLNFGVLSSVGSYWVTDKFGVRRQYWKIRIGGQENLMRFRGCVGFNTAEKVRKLDALIEHGFPEPAEVPLGFCQCGCGARTLRATRTIYSQRLLKGEPKPFLKGHKNRTTVGGVGEASMDRIPNLNARLKALHSRFYEQGRGCSWYSNGSTVTKPSSDRLSILLEKYAVFWPVIRKDSEWQCLMNMARSDLLFLPVRQVVADGRERTFDLKMDGEEHNFLANGIVCHNSGANFGFGVAHIEQREEDEFPHVVFDLLTYWSPKDFPENNNEIDYEVVTEACKGYILSFAPTEFTFDQYGASAWMIQQLRRFQSEKKLPRRTDVFERTATAPQNWAVAEAAKTAIGLGLVHAPDCEQARLELKFLQKVADEKVDHPTAGPVQTKDVADCVMILTHALIGQQMAAFVGASLSQMTPSASQVNGFPLLPVSQQSEAAPAAFSGLASFGRSQRREQGYSPARGSRFSRPPRR